GTPPIPAPPPAAPGFQRSNNRVPQQIDEELIELIRIGLNSHFGAGLQLHLQTRFESRDAANPYAHVDTLKSGRRQFCEARVRAHEPREAVGTAGDDVEAAAQFVAPGG